MGFVMKSCYIAGPMRGYPEYNFPAFDTARDYLRSTGWNATSPADLDRDAVANGGFAEGHVFTDEEIRELARRDVDAIMQLRRSQGDAIVLLPGWQDSTGARAEVALGLWLRLPFYLFQTDYRGRASLRLIRPEIHGVTRE